MAVTWNPSDHYQLTFSNGNLTVAGITNTIFEATRATLGRASGKRYFEARIDAYTSNYMWIGLAKSTVTLNGASPTLSADCWALLGYNSNGYKVNSGSSVSLGAWAAGVGSIAMVAVDFSTGSVWFGHEGTWFGGGDPAAGTGAQYTGLSGTLYPLACCRGGVNTQYTARFATADLTYSPPSGFSAWDTSITAEIDDSVTSSDQVTHNASIIALDTQYSSDLLFGGFSAQSFDGASSTDTLGQGLFVPVPFSDAGTLADSLPLPILLATMTDSAAATEALSAALLLSGSQADTLNATDRLTSLELPPPLLDTLSPGDLATSIELSAITDISASADALAGKSVIAGSVADTMPVAESLSGDVLAPINDEQGSADTLGESLSLVQLDDSVGAVEAAASVLALHAMATDGLTSSDQAEGLLRLIASAVDAAMATDALLAGEQLVCVVNIETGAVSTYALPTVTGLCHVDGRLFVATDDGLFVIEGETDDGAVIPWRFMTGFSNLGTDRLKSVPNVNVLASGAAATLHVVHARNGEKTEYRYSIPRTPAGTARDQVIRAGKGAQSVYWQLGASGSGRTEIAELRPIVIPLSRRR